MHARGCARLLFPLKAVVRWLDALARDRRGTVAVFVGAAIIPLIGALGLATDAARGYMVKARLSQALDAAALAGGKAIFSPNRDADVQMFFDANFPPGFMGATVNPLDIDVDPTNTYITVSASAEIGTTFMRVLGFDSITVSTSTEVTRVVDQLDVVISIDTSGSMCQSCDKIAAAKAAAVDLVNILFGDRTESPTVEIDGTTYDLLNVGLVNWNAKVNVSVIGQTYDSGATSTITVSEFTNPVTGAQQNVLYEANNSPVPFLSPPGANWKGCVYARYTGDSSNTNDADLSLGPTTVGGAQWMGWEPITYLEGEPQSGRWNESSDWDDEPKNCHQQYWNDELDDPDHPASVADAQPWWRPAVPRIDDNDRNPYNDNNECTACPSVGILPLQTQKAVITDAINSLETGGNTNIPQGLAWAWEVLMPGEPFDEALETVPFPRQRAIVLLTDGEIVGGNGDAYKGRFGEGSGAGTTTNSAHGYLPSPPAAANTRNNLNNRLIQLAANVKAQGIRLYVIQFDNNTTALTTLLKKVASEPAAPYYYYAPDEATLRQAFKEIANNLSKLRLSK